MKLTLTIAMDNEAFAGEPGYEASRILRKLANRLGDDPDLQPSEFPITDLNGNKVGSVIVSE